MVQRLVEMLEIGLSTASISWDTAVPGALGLYSTKIPQEKAGLRLCSSPFISYDGFLGVEVV